MIKGRKSVIFSVVILVLLISAYVFLTQSQLRRESSSKKDLEIFTINKYDIASILCMPKDDDPFEVQYADGEYTVKDYGPFKFDHQKLEALFDACSIVIAERIIGAPEENLSEYGLDDPEMSLEITDINGSSRVLSIGIAGQLGETRYVYYHDEDLIFLLNYQQANQMLALPEDYRIAEVFSESWSKEIEDISYLRIDYNDERPTLELCKRTPDERLSDNYSKYYLTSPYMLDTLDEVVEKQLLAPLLGMDESVHVVEDFPSHEMIKVYSFDNPHSIKLRNSSDDEIEILIGGKVGDFRFIKLGDSSPIMIVPSEQVEFIEQKKFDLIKKDLITFYDNKMISAIEIMATENSFLIKKEDEHGMSIQINNKSISNTDTEKFLELLDRLKLAGETTELVKEDKAVCTIKVFTQDKGYEYAITLYPINTRIAAVYYNETATGFFVNIESASELIEWLKSFV